MFSGQKDHLFKQTRKLVLQRLADGSASRYDLEEIVAKTLNKCREKINTELAIVLTDLENEGLVKKELCPHEKLFLWQLTQKTSKN
ncbi:MAG: hypothetical protein ACFFBD_17225 [Candidatus Hodarchaeota archaeon]